MYQIYPASFQDSTGSGSGDLGGIIERVDYIHHLGVDIVWICPIFESPQVDMVSKAWPPIGSFGRAFLGLLPWGPVRLRQLARRPAADNRRPGL